MRCEIDQENERRELNSKSIDSIDAEDEVEDGEALFSRPAGSSKSNDGEELFRSLDLSLSAFYPDIFKRR